MLNRKKSKLSILALFCSSLCLIGAEVKPNVVVFLVDDLGYMDIGANNPNCLYDTPNIDAFAKEAMRFTDGYASSPICSPTRYSLLTGRYPTRVAATNFFPKTPKKPARSGKYNPAAFIHEMPLSEVTLADAMKSMDYATFFAGKWHLGHGEEYAPENRGFDINFGGHSAGGPYTGKKYFAPYENPAIAEEGPAGEHLPDRLARETVSFIRENKESPFFAYLSFYSVHTPLMGRKDLVEKYEKRFAKLDGKEFADIVAAGRKNKKVRTKQHHAVYAAMVEAMDEAVGKVIKELKESGQWDNTIIVFTSDNGGLSTSEGSPTSNLPLNGGKGWLYEGGIREPWIIHYPEVTKAGSVSKQVISSIDLFPTLVNAVGYETKHVIDGVDIRPFLEGESIDRDALFWHYPHYSNQGGIPGGAIRMGDFKLVENYEDGSIALFNLKEDLGELNDIAANHPEKVAMMRDRLHEWYENLDARFLAPKGKKTPWRPY